MIAPPLRIALLAAAVAAGGCRNPADGGEGPDRDTETAARGEPTAAARPSSTPAGPAAGQPAAGRADPAPADGEAPAPAAAAAATGGSPAPSRRPQPGDDLVQVRLLAGRAAWPAGGRVWLGVSFTIEPGWHLYWEGFNDSGLPVAVDWTLPEGWTAGDLRWPVPERSVWPGGTGLDHVYHDEVTLLLPLDVPPGAEPGRPRTVRADIDWLVCEEACLPGGARVELALPVGDTDAPERRPDAERLAAAREALPGPVPAALSAGWERGELVLRLPGATTLVFMPHRDALPLADVLGRGAVDGEVLRLRPDDSLTGGHRVLGILVAEVGGTRRAAWIDLPGPDGP